MKIKNKFILIFHLILIRAKFIQSFSFTPVGNIIIASIGFFNPLVRVARVFYNNSKNSSSNLRYESLNHPEYSHLQAASDMEVTSLIKEKKRRNIKNKSYFFREEIVNFERDNKTIEESKFGQIKKDQLNQIPLEQIAINEQNLTEISSNSSYNNETNIGFNFKNSSIT